MAEPLKERVSLALRDLLRAIEGDGGVTRHYTPSAVVRAEAFEDAWLDTSIDGDKVLIFCIPDEAEDVDSTYTAVGTVQAYDIIVAKVHTPAVVNPLDPDYDTEENPTRETIQHRLEADVKNQIRGDKRLTSDDDPNGLALHITIPTTEKGPQDTYHDGWAVVFMRVEVQLDHEDEAA